MSYRLLEEARKEKGITIEEISRQLDINPSTWHRWVRGEHDPLLPKAVKACKILGVNMLDLIGEEGK